MYNMETNALVTSCTTVYSQLRVVRLSLTPGLCNWYYTVVDVRCRPTHCLQWSL